MAFLSFFKHFGWPVILAVAGAAFLALDMIGRYQQIASFGLPAWGWQIIGALLILSAIILFFYQVHKRLEAVIGAPSEGLAKLLMPAKDTKEQVRARNERREAIRQARSLIAEATGSIAPLPEFGTMLQSSYCFYKLRPHFSEQFRQMLVPNPHVIAVDVSGSPVPGLARVFADEVDRIEKEWGLS